MIDVQLSSEEVQAAYDAAVAINQNKADLGMQDSSEVYGVSSLESRFTSHLAEAAVNKLLGLPPMTWEVLRGGDGKIDIRHPNGCTIQVKYRRDRERDLATEGLDFHEELKADLYVLVWPAEDPQTLIWDATHMRPVAMTVVGWCHRQEFLNRIINRPPVRMRGKKWEMRWKALADPQYLRSAVEAHIEEKRQIKMRYFIDGVAVA